MNKKFKICVISAACCAVGLTSSLLYAFREKGVEPAKQAWLTCVKKPALTPGSPNRIISEKGFFYEDFESMTPGQLGSGWTTLATPGMPDDCWSVATLGTDDKGIAGISGYQYAYILGNRDPQNKKGHDAWLFSPAVDCEAGTEYKIEFLKSADSDLRSSIQSYSR